MARGLINVETTRLDSTASQVEALADAYEGEYTALFGTVQQLQNAWSGADNTAFTSQIEGFRDDFQKMTKLMRDYAEYLRKTASTYRQAQQDTISAAKTLSQGS